jgi:hypothetical protein
LDKATTVAEDHLWLSPEVRLLADHPDIKEYVLDMDHHSIVLPADQRPTSSIPLIVLGGECSLRLKNAVIYNADSLAPCLSLAPGARLFLEDADGVELTSTAPVHFMDPVASAERSVGLLPGAFASSAIAKRPKSGHFQVNAQALRSLSLACFGWHTFASLNIEPFGSTICRGNT